MPIALAPFPQGREERGVLRALCARNTPQILISPPPISGEPVLSLAEGGSRVGPQARPSSGHKCCTIQGSATLYTKRRAFCQYPFESTGVLTQM